MKIEVSTPEGVSITHPTDHDQSAPSSTRAVLAGDSVLTLPEVELTPLIRRLLEIRDKTVATNEGFPLPALLDDAIAATSAYYSSHPDALTLTAQERIRLVVLDKEYAQQLANTNLKAISGLSQMIGISDLLDQDTILQQTAKPIQGLRNLLTKIIAEIPVSAEDIARHRPESGKEISHMLTALVLWRGYILQTLHQNATNPTSTSRKIYALFSDHKISWILLTFPRSPEEIPQIFRQIQEEIEDERIDPLEIEIILGEGVPDDVCNHITRVQRIIDEHNWEAFTVKVDDISRRRGWGNEDEVMYDLYKEEVLSTAPLESEIQRKLARLMRLGRAARRIVRQSQVVSDGIDIYFVTTYFGEVRIFTTKEQEHLLSWIDMGVKACEILYLTNLRLVIPYVKKYKSRGIPLWDLVQAGNRGLADGLEKFDERYQVVTRDGVEKPVELSTYVTWWIRQRVDREFWDLSGVMRVPLNHRSKGGRDAKPKNNSGGYKSAVDLGTIAIGPISNILRPLRIDGADEEGYPDDGNDDAIEIVDPKAQRPFHEFDEQTRIDSLYKLLKRAKLTDKEIRVVILRSGFDSDDEGLTLEEIGKILGVTRERIRQIQGNVKTKIENFLARNEMTLDGALDRINALK